MTLELFISLVTIFASMSSIVFAFLAFKRNEKNEIKKEGKNEGLILSDIGYIKACVDRGEKNMTRIDEKYKDVLERLSRVEESLVNVTKRVDETYVLERG